jgi:hypothetical protein
MMKNLSVALGALAFCLTLSFSLAPRDEIETVIHISAAPERVWEVLTDPDVHVASNPSMRMIEGRFAPDERLRLVAILPSGGEMTVHPTVLVADTERELRWRGRLALPRLFDGEHYFLLEPEGDGTRLTHGETFHGVLLWFVDVEQFLPAFIAANEGLRAHAEASVGG